MEPNQADNNSNQQPEDQPSPEPQTTAQPKSSVTEPVSRPEQPEQPEPAETQVQPTVVVGNHQGSRAKKLLIGLLVLILLTGLAYAVYAMTKSEDKASTTSVVSAKKDIAELTVGVINEEVALYPADETNAYTQSVNNQIYEGLVRYQDQTKIVPLLATGWSNPDDSTWDFDLKPNVTFHNGHLMTAADVVYSLNLAAKNEDLSGVFADTIKESKALSDHKVRVTTTKPDPFFLNKMSFLLIVDSKAPDATDTSNGTGPYKLKPGTKPSAEAISLVAYDKYHGGHVYTRALNFKAEADEAAATADLKAGKVNLVGEYNAKDPAGLSSISHQNFVVNDPGVTFMALNTVAAGPLQKKEVREALRDSLDTSLLIKNSSTYAVPASQLVTKAIPGYNPAVTIPKRDVAKAKAQLTKAGYPNGVSLNLFVAPTSLAAAKEVAVQAKEAGFNITVKEEPEFGTLIGNMIEGKNDITIIAYSSDVLDGSDVFSQVIQQTANYKSQALDDYLTQAAATVDKAKRLEILQKTSKLLADDVAAVPLFNKNRTWITDKNYALQFHSLSAAPGIYFWEVYATK